MSDEISSVSSRDLTMARLAAARGFAMRVTNQIDEVIEFFLIPEEDLDGQQRADLFEDVIEDAGRLSRVVEKAQAAFEEMDPSEPAPEESDDDDDATEDPGTDGAETEGRATRAPGRR